MPTSEFSVGKFLVDKIANFNTPKRCKTFTKPMNTDKSNKFSHIKFGFRGEGIYYNLEGKEYGFDSTWFGGINICLRDLSDTNLDEKQKTILTKVKDKIDAVGTPFP